MTFEKTQSTRQLSGYSLELGPSNLELTSVSNIVYFMESPFYNHFYFVRTEKWKKSIKNNYYFSVFIVKKFPKY